MEEKDDVGVHGRKKVVLGFDVGGLLVGYNCIRNYLPEDL
jgi:hypothetical protein